MIELIVQMLAIGYVAFVLAFAARSESRGASKSSLPKVYLRLAFYVLSPILFLFAYLESIDKKGRRWG